MWKLLLKSLTFSMQNSVISLVLCVEHLASYESISKFQPNSESIKGEQRNESLLKVFI